MLVVIKLYNFWYNCTWKHEHMPIALLPTAQTRLTDWIISWLLAHSITESPSERNFSKETETRPMGQWNKEWNEWLGEKRKKSQNFHCEIWESIKYAIYTFWKELKWKLVKAMIGSRSTKAHHNTSPTEQTFCQSEIRNNIQWNT